MSEPVRRSGRAGLLALLTVLAALLASCAQIPESGVPAGTAEVAPVQPAAGSGVRVVAEGPRPGDSIYETVSGFLAASGTVEPRFATARQYLTPAASKGWNPGAAILVFDEEADELSEIADGKLQLVAPARGEVDDQGVFTAPEPESEVMATFSLTEVAGEWRIAAVPDRLVISEQDFEREYAAVDTYFLTGEGSSAVLVPDPKYLPKLADLPNELAAALFRGPSRWLDPAVSTAVPPGAQLAEPVQVVGDLVRVNLTPGSVPPDGVARDNLLGQLVMTLTEDPNLQSVEVNAGGEPVTYGGAGEARLDREDPALRLPADLRPRTPEPVFLREAVAFTGSPPAQGPFPPELKLAEIAVSPGETSLAGIAKNRQTLWTAPAGAPDQRTVRLEGTALRSASFDGRGNLWVIAGEGDQAVVYRIPPAGNPVAAVPSGFVASQVRRLQVASDGARMALVLDTGFGPQAWLALVTEPAGAVAVGLVRRIGQGLENPRDIAWSAADRLVVLGTERGGQPQPFVLALGGGVVDALTSLADIESIAAAPGQPMIAGTTENQIWRLGGGGNWTRVEAGTRPAYPG